MNYVKKMCILRQVKQGFSGDGKALSGLVKVEQYGKNLAVEVSIINFAPLVSGEYYCLLSDEKRNTEMLPLRGKSLFNILSDMDVSSGFCAVVCYVKNEIVPIAYGVNGNGNYDWRDILASTLPPLFGKKTEQKTVTAIADAEDKNEEIDEEIDEEIHPQTETAASRYDDDTVATENYYQAEEERGQELFCQTGGDAQTQSETENEREETGADASENVDAERLLHPFKTDSDGYYLSVKSEIDELLKNYPRDDRLCGAFSSSEWARIKGTEDDPQYLVGVVYEDGKARYVCYALKAENKNEPPEEIKNVCSFVPASPFDEETGFFVIFQSAATGECIKPERA